MGLVGRLGTVGERRDWTLTLQGRFEYETDYGITYGHVYKDADGNVTASRAIEENLMRRIDPGAERNARDL